MKKLFFRTVAVCMMACALLGTAAAVDADAPTVSTLPAGTQAVVPALMYHHFSPTVGNSMTVSTARLQEQLTALEQAGFHTVTSAQVLAFVDEGVPLPENPLWITLDDGYASNLEIAAPLLEQHDMQATIFAVGVTNGADTYRQTGVPITPHFAYEQAKPWIEKGVVEVMSHGYDMHQVEALDGENCRMGAILLPHESLFSYMHMFVEDVTRSRTEIEAVTGAPVTVFAYPYGRHNGVSEGLLREMGVRASFTIAPINNLLTVGDPDSLYALGRHFAYETHTGAALVQMLRTADVHEN